MGRGNGWTIFIIFSLNKFNLIFTIFASKIQNIPFLESSLFCKLILFAKILNDQIIKWSVWSAPCRLCVFPFVSQRSWKLWGDSSQDRACPHRAWGAWPPGGGLSHLFMFFLSWTQRQAGLSERLLSQGCGENISHLTVMSCSLTRKVRPGLKTSYRQKKKNVLPIRYFMLPAKQALMTDSTFRVGSNPSFPQEFEVSHLFIISMSLCVSSYLRHT